MMLASTFFKELKCLIRYQDLPSLGQYFHYRIMKDFLEKDPSNSFKNSYDDDQAHSFSCFTALTITLVRHLNIQLRGWTAL